MGVRRSWKVMTVGGAGLALIVAVILFSKSAPAGPTVTVYKSPT